jgi:hypothetical protein
MNTHIPATITCVSRPEAHATDPKLVTVTVFFRDEHGKSYSKKYNTPSERRHIERTGPTTITLSPEGKVVDWTAPRGPRAGVTP